MNGHPDADVISRLSKSTIEDLSCYIVFIKELMVKMVVHDEAMTFACFSMKDQFFCDFGDRFGTF